MRNPLKGNGGKKFLVLVVFAFVGYVLFSNPTGAAGAVNSTTSSVESGANSISVFVDTLQLPGGGQ